MINAVRTIGLMMMILVAVTTFVTPQKSTAQLKTIDEVRDDCLNGDKETGSFSVKCLTIKKDQGESFMTGGESPLINLILEVINILARVIGSIAIIAFIIGGYFLMTAAGDENQIERGKDIFLSAIIGIIVVFMSYTIVRVIQAIFY